MKRFFSFGVTYWRSKTKAVDDYLALIEHVVVSVTKLSNTDSQKIF